MIFGIVGNKGGIGKTTLSVHLACWLSERGKKVALIDSDPQGSSSRWVRAVLPSLRVEKLTISDDIIETAPQLAEEYDCVVVDGLPGLSDITRAILLIADRAILPCGPSQLDLLAVFEAVRVLRQAQQIRGGKPDALIVPNRLQSRYRLSKELMLALESLGVPITSGLGLRQPFADAPGQSTLVWHMNGAAQAAEEIEKLLTEVVRDGE